MSTDNTKLNGIKVVDVLAWIILSIIEKIYLHWTVVNCIVGKYKYIRQRLPFIGT